jgi:hypothetical protein
VIQDIQTGSPAGGEMLKIALNTLHHYYTKNLNDPAKKT